MTRCISRPSPPPRLDPVVAPAVPSSSSSCCGPLLKNSRSPLCARLPPLPSTATFTRNPYKKKSEFRIRIRSRFNQVSGSGSVLGIRIQNQEGKNDPHESRKNLEISCFEVLDVLFWELKASFATWTPSSATFTTRNSISETSVADPGSFYRTSDPDFCPSRIPDPDFSPSRIPDLGFWDPGS